MIATIYPVTDATPNRIAIVARPRGNDWLREEISALSGEGVEILVSMLTNEEAEELGLNHESAECAAAGINFVNVAISDRSVPSDRRAFLRSVEELAMRVRKGAILQCIAVPASGARQYSPHRSSCGWDGMRKKHSMLLNRHEDVRCLIRPSRSSGSSLTFPQSADWRKIPITLIALNERWPDCDIRRNVNASRRKTFRVKV